MILFGHAADFHFGRTKFSSLDTSTGLQTSLVNDIEAFNEFIGLAEEAGCEFLLMAGDVFDKIHVSNAVRKEVAAAFKRILATMSLYVIVGTHDRAHDRYAAHTLSDWMNLAGGEADHMSRLYIFEQPESVFHCDKSGNPTVQIIAFPEPTKGLLEGVSYQKYFERELARFQIREDIPVILLGHFSVAGAKFGDEVLDIASLRPKESISLNYLDSLPIDYVALGHIHVAQELGETGKIVYPGSLNYCSFSEVNEKKGAYICSFEGKELTKRRVFLQSPIALREIEIDLSTELDPNRKACEILATHDLANAIVKVKLTLAEESPKIEEGRLKHAAVGCKNLHVSSNVQRGMKVRDAGLTYELSLHEAYDRYMSLLEYAPDVKTKMKEEFDILHEMLLEKMRDDQQEAE